MCTSVDSAPARPGKRAARTSSAPGRGLRLPRGRGRGEVAPEVRSGQNPWSRIGPVDTVLRSIRVVLRSHRNSPHLTRRSLPVRKRRLVGGSHLLDHLTLFEVRSPLRKHRESLLHLPGLILRHSFEGLAVTAPPGLVLSEGGLHAGSGHPSPPPSASAPPPSARLPPPLPPPLPALRRCASRASSSSSPKSCSSLPRTR